MNIKTGAELDEFIQRCYGETRQPGEPDDQFRSRVLANVYGVGGPIGQTVNNPSPFKIRLTTPVFVGGVSGTVSAYSPTDPIRVTAGIYKGCRGVIRQDTGQPGGWFADLPGIGITRLLETEIQPDTGAASKPDAEQPSLPSTPPPPPAACAFCESTSKRQYPYGTRDRKWPICESTRCWSAALIAKEWLETGGIQESEELLRDAVRRAVSREPKRY